MLMIFVKLRFGVRSLRPLLMYILDVHPVMWSAEHLEILQCPPPLRTLPSAAAPSSGPGIPSFGTRMPFDYYLTNMHCVVSQDPNLIHRQIGLRQVVNSIIEDRKKKVADLGELIVTRESFPNWPYVWIHDFIQTLS